MNPEESHRAITRNLEQAEVWTLSPDPDERDLPKAKLFVMNAVNLISREFRKINITYKK